MNLALRVKQQITDKDSVFIQVGYFDSESGDVAQYYNQASASPTFRAAEKQEPNFLLGYHREWSPGNHTLAMFSRIDDKLKLNDSNAGPLARTTYTFIDLGGNTVTNDFLWNPNDTTLGYESELQAYSIELQQIWQTVTADADRRRPVSVCVGRTPPLPVSPRQRAVRRAYQCRAIARQRTGPFQRLWLRTF